MLQRHHDVLAPTLMGHAGGPALVDDAGVEEVADAVERAMDEAGFETAHVVGNSLGGYLALHLAARGRARTVVAFAPGGGWAAGDESYKETLAFFPDLQPTLQRLAPHAEALVATAEGRRRSTAFIVEHGDHIPGELLAHLIRAAATCEATIPFTERARSVGWSLDPEKITCPVRIVWGTEDKLLPWPSATVRYREEWVPQADWVELEGVGHCPQLDVPLVAADLILGFTAP